jgi:putative membrane protein
MTEQTRTLLAVGVLFLVVLLGLPLLWGGLMMWGMMGGMMGPGMMGGWWAGANPWWGVVGLVFWVLMLAGLGLLALWAIRQVGPEQAGSRRAVEILKERYARGELTREQYEQMRRDLEQ